jgi:membrane associated rhomboid family serine protease
VAFHESFWVVTGTAAPVIALAAVVALGEILRDMGASGEKFMRVLLDSSPDNAEVVKWMADVSRKPTRKMVRALHAAVLSNLLLQSAFLAVSLVSLVDEANLVPPWIAIAAAVGGLLLLAATAFGASAFRFQQLTLEGAMEDLLRSMDK